MSLINEALKKAQRTTAQRDAASRGVPVPMTIAGGGPRDRNWSSILALPIVAAAVLTGIGAVGWMFVQHSPASARADRQVSTPAAQVRVATPRFDPAAQERVEQAVEAIIETPPEATPEVIPKVPVEVVPVTAPAFVPNPAPVPAPAQDQEFVQTLEMPGYPRLHLGGIAWSAFGGSAILNGRIVGVGDEIEGVKLISVERKRVRLSVGGANVYLHMP